MAAFNTLSYCSTQQILSVARFSALLVACLLLSGCAKFLLGEKALNRNPIEKPSINLSNFSMALECMDQMQLDYNSPTLVITAQDIPNKTAEGGPLVGTKDMLMTSLSKISERSNRVHFVSYGTELRDIILLHKVHDGRNDFVTPDYFILGSITQLDKNVLASRFGGALNDDNWNASFSSGQGISYAGLDLNVGLIKNLQMIPGITSSNVLALYDRGAGSDLGGRINSVGAFFDFGIDRRDGLGQAIRNMMDLAVIELVGKLQDLPYLSCLPVDPNHVEVDAIIRKEYLRYQQNPEKLVKAIQGRLRQLGYYRGPVDGQITPMTTDAIQYFRTLNQLPTNNILAFDYEFYKSVMYREPYHWDSKDPAVPPLRRVSTEPQNASAFKYTQIQQQNQALSSQNRFSQTQLSRQQPRAANRDFMDDADSIESMRQESSTPSENSPSSSTEPNQNNRAPSPDQPTFNDSVRKESGYGPSRENLNNRNEANANEAVNTNKPSLWGKPSVQNPQTNYQPRSAIFDN